MEVDHGPILLDNNIMLSPSSQLVWSQGVVYAHNLIAGQFEVIAHENRETPVLQPHGTQMLSLKDNPSGDVQLYRNIFSGPDCSTRAFDKTELPSKLSGNIYLNGARAAKSDSNCVVISEPVALTLDSLRQVVHYTLPSQVQQLLSPVLSTAGFGKTMISRQDFNNVDGQPIMLDTDFFGRKSDARIPGPIQP